MKRVTVVLCVLVLTLFTLFKQKDKNKSRPDQPVAGGKAAVVKEFPEPAGRKEVT